VPTQHCPMQSIACLLPRSSRTLLNPVGCALSFQSSVKAVSTATYWKKHRCRSRRGRYVLLSWCRKKSKLSGGDTLPAPFHLISHARQSMRGPSGWSTIAPPFVSTVCYWVLHRLHFTTTCAVLPADGSFLRFLPLKDREQVPPLQQPPVFLKGPSSWMRWLPNVLP